MKDRTRSYARGLAALTLLFSACVGIAQNTATVPTMVKFSGTVHNAPSRFIGVTFALYKEEQGGAPLWMETQSVPVDSAGHYTVQLGSTQPAGLPKELFASGEARWMGVQPEGQQEQTRVLLLSVPYALKAADAETIGGIPASAFVLRSQSNPEATAVRKKAGTVVSRNTPPPPGALNVTTAGGTVNFLPLFSTSTDIENSVIAQSATSIGINTPSPGATLDVNGTANVRGNLSSTAFVNSASGYELGGSLFGFSPYDSSNVYLGFAGNASVSGTQNTGVGSLALAQITSGLNNTAVGRGALKVDANGSNNVAVGLNALHDNVTGGNNTAVGTLALRYATATDNAAFGSAALQSNVAGTENAGMGTSALYSNTSGSYNTAVGSIALWANTTGTYNTAVGYGALADRNVTGLTNATAIGANSDVTASNSLVLGSISGVNFATADTNVGIGVTAPVAKLHIGAPSVPGTISLRVEGPSASGTGGFAGSFGGFGDFNIDAFGIVGGRFTVKENGNVQIGNVQSSSIVTTVFGTANFKKVGIGTSSPDSNLSVQGGADKTGGGSWAVFSDRRLKDLNGNFSSGLSQIMKINPIRYRYKDKNGMDIHDSDEHVGLVAQEVQKVIPEAVTENSKGYLLINNDPIIWAMLNAIKEQQRQIRKERSVVRTQQAAIRELQSQLKETRQSLAKIKTKVDISQNPVLATR